MKSFRLELTEQEAEQLNALAIAHGNKFKPFAEYLLRLQLGTVPPPTVRPVVIPSQGNPVKEEPKTVEPSQGQPQTETLKKKALKVAKQIIAESRTEPKTITPQEDDIKERFGVFTYKGEYYNTRAEAEAARG